MENDDLCSICCVGYRHAPYIADCIHSIWKNQYPAKEIIALDDGSGDGSVEILENLQKESPCPMQVILQERTGNVGRNFNRAFAAASGDFILFIALDDMLTEDAIDSKMAILRADPACAFAANTLCLKLHAAGGMTLSGSPLQRLAKKEAEDILRLERTIFHSFYIQAAIFRRKLLTAIHVFNENMIGDDIVLRTKALLYLQKRPDQSFALIDAPGVIYRDHAGNLHKNSLRQLELVLQYHSKFWPHEPLPPIVKTWIMDAMPRLDFANCLKIFTFAPNSTSALLQDADIVAMLRMRAAAMDVQPDE